MRFLTLRIWCSSRIFRSKSWLQNLFLSVSELISYIFLYIILLKRQRYLLYGVRRKLYPAYSHFTWLPARLSDYTTVELSESLSRLSTMLHAERQQIERPMLQQLWQLWQLLIPDCSTKININGTVLIA